MIESTWGLHRILWALVAQMVFGVRLYFGGSSSSRQTTSNIDARVVGGDGSSNVSVSGNSGPVSVTSTDHGAVQGGLQLALAGVEGANRLAEQAQASQGGILSGALRMASEQQQQFATALTNVKTSDVRVLIIAGLAVVALVAASMFKRGGS